MARGLGTLILVVFLFQGITFASGLGPVIGWFTRTQHILWGLLTAFLLLFTHTATMFYLIGRGKYVKEVTQELSLGGEFIERTREIKRMFFPWATYSIVVTIGVTTAGGIAAVWSGWHLFHGILAGIGVGLNSFTLWRGLMGIGHDLALGAEMEALDGKDSRTPAEG